MQPKKQHRSPRRPLERHPSQGRPSSAGWPSWSSSIVVGGAVGQQAADRRRSGLRRVRPGRGGARRRRSSTPTSEVVLVQSDDADGDRPAVRGGGRRSDAQACGAVPRSTRSARRPTAAARSPPTATRRWSNSRSRATTNRPKNKVDASLAATAAVQAHNPDVRVEQFGDASASKALEEVFSEDLEQGRDDLAAGHPADPAARLRRSGRGPGAAADRASRAVIATIGLLALPSQLVPMDPNVSSVVVLVGLAVGVDYSLFYMRREREERRAGRSASASLRRRGGDLGPGGAGLRPDRDRGDGGDAAQRRPDLHLVRGRDDDRRRGGDVRLADGPAGGALEARRPGREGPDPVPAPPAPSGVTAARSGRRHRRASCAGRSSRWSPRPGVLIALAVPALGHAHGRQRRR